MTATRDDDAALSARAAHGDRAAFGALTARHEARLRAFAARIVGAADADDVAQEALVKAWLALAGLRADESFASWLTGIAWRTALDHLRHTKRRGVRDAAWHEIDDTTTASAGTERIELERALAALNAKERAALVLCHGHGWSHGEAARIMGVPLGTLKSLAARAKAKARSAIEGVTT